MRTICEEPWRHRLGSSSLQKVVAFRAEELTLGCGTVLWKAASGLSNILSLSSDAAHDRLVALLVVAGRGHLAKAALLQLDTALNEWHRGDHALAAIRLALVRLPAVRDLGEAHTLFLAEIALDAGLSPNDLLKELGYARCLPLLKDYRSSDKPVISEAYFLPSTAPSGRVSFDDCKLRNTPTTLPIPALKPGDMFELKAGGWGWELGVPGSAAYRQFRNQLKNQNEAVATEGRGRQIYYCVPSAAKAISAAKIFGGAYPNSHFLVCR